MLTRLFVRFLVKNPEDCFSPDVRLAYGILAGVTGIVVNVLLFGVKLTVGICAGSIAVAADAVNNLSDAGSSVVTLVGFKLSSRPADADHPFGHGRLEYIAGVIVSVIVVSVGFDFLKEAVMRLFETSNINAGKWTWIVLAAAILGKLWLFLFYRFIADKTGSKVIKAAAIDSLSDIGCTGAVMAAAWVAGYTRFPVDAVAGFAVALLILYSGINILRETINPLLGECPTPELVEELRSRLLTCGGIKGVHDIIIHNYGPNHYFATAHAEIEQNGTLLSAHDMLENAEVEIARNMPVRLLLHCDPYNATDPVVKEWRAQMEDIVGEFDCKLKLYDFRLNGAGEDLELHFHLLIPREYKFSTAEVHKILRNALKNKLKDVAVPELKIEFINSYV